MKSKKILSLVVLVVIVALVIYYRDWLLDTAMFLIAGEVKLKIWWLYIMSSASACVGGAFCGLLAGGSDDYYDGVYDGAIEVMKLMRAKARESRSGPDDCEQEFAEIMSIKGDDNG